MACSNETEKLVKVGSRKSQLALIQTNKVVGLLQKHVPNDKFEIISMTTTGDNILDTALSKIGEKSLFTKELEVALLERQVDFVVHSLKDLPTELPPGLAIGAICKRDDPRDALVLRTDQTAKNLSSMPSGSIIGTSSLRRAAQLKRKYPHLKIADVRGNLNTRLRKLDETGEFHAIILAAAGLERMGWQERISQILDVDECMYAVGQGAMAVECRSDDEETLTLLSSITDIPTLLQCVAERAFLRRLEGGCSVPVSIHSVLEDNLLTLHGGVFSIDGSSAVLDTLSTSIGNLQRTDQSGFTNESKRQYAAVLAPNVPVDVMQAVESLGIDLATKLMEAGAAEILQAAKKQTADEIMRQKAAKEASKLTALSEPAIA